MSEKFNFFEKPANKDERQRTPEILLENANEKIDNVFNRQGEKFENNL